MGSVQKPAEDQSSATPEDGEEEEISEEVAPIEEVLACVRSMRCGVDVNGVKSPVTRKEFYITFALQDGTTEEYEVDEESYVEFEEGMKGTLLSANGHFCGFVLDEEKI